MIIIDNDIVKALEIVSAWNIPEEEFIQVLTDHARLMSGVTPDELWEVHAEQH